MIFQITPFESASCIRVG